MSGANVALRMPYCKLGTCSCRFQGKAPVVAAKELPRLLQEAGALLGL